MKLICYLLIVILTASCVPIRNNNVSIEVNRVNEVKLSESEKKIGKLQQLLISSDSLIYVLDRTSYFIHQYSWNGEYLKSFGGKGSSPNELQNPVFFCVDEKKKELVIGEYQLGIKFFETNQKISKTVFIEENQIFISSGDISVIKNEDLLLTGFYDAKKQEKSLCIISREGKVLREISFVPDEYNKYMLDGGRMHDIRESGEFVVAFSQSPALFLGNIYEGKWKKYDFDEMRDKYISKRRKKDSINRFEEMIELLKEEALNYKVCFLNDTIVARASSMYSEKGISDKSYLSRKNKKLEFFKTKDEKIMGIMGNAEIHGKLHCVFNGHLVIEESDEPDNRRFGLYEVKFITQK